MMYSSVKNIYHPQELCFSVYGRQKSALYRDPVEVLGYLREHGVGGAQAAVPGPGGAASIPPANQANCGPSLPLSAFVVLTQVTNIDHQGAARVSLGKVIN